MKDSDVSDVLAVLAAGAIPAVLDGGWGVDALNGRPTRSHRDLDVVVDRENLASAVNALRKMGFVHDIDQQPGLPARVVMVDDSGRTVDIHPILLDDAGCGWQQLSDEATTWGLFPAHGLRGVGVIGGNRVRCTTPELQVRHHLGYPLSERDLHDLLVLREQFRLPVPPSVYREVEPIQLA